LGYSHGWVQDSIDLTPYVGSTVYIKILFISEWEPMIVMMKSDVVVSPIMIPFIFIPREGAYIDDIVITAVPHNDAESGGDAGDDFNTATQISAGSYDGFVESFDINDYYKVYLSAGNTINVNMTPSSGSNFDIALYNLDEEFIDESTLSGSVMDSVSHTAETSGYHFIQVYYISGSSTYELEIEIEDHVPPTLSITSPTNSSEVESSTVQVTWTGSDLDTGIDHYEVKLDDGSWINIANTDFNFTEVSNGSHTILVKAVDGADNSKEVIVNFTVNTGILFGLDFNTMAIIGAAVVVVIVVVAYLILRGRKPPTPTPISSSPPIAPPT